MSTRMRPLRRRERRDAIAAVALVVVHASWLALGRAGGRALSDILFVVVPAASATACFLATRRLVGRARLAWALFGVTGMAWAAANVIWAWYEVVLQQTVPVPSPADPLYVAA